MHGEPIPWRLWKPSGWIYGIGTMDIISSLLYRHKLTFQKPPEFSPYSCVTRIIMNYLFKFSLYISSSLLYHRIHDDIKEGWSQSRPRRMMRDEKTVWDMHGCGNRDCDNYDWEKCWNGYHCACRLDCLLVRWLSIHERTAIHHTIYLNHRRRW